MSTTKLSDAEVHALVIERIGTMTREEWQARLDAAAKVFGRDEATVGTGVRNGSHPKSSKASKSSPKVATEVVLG
jgi:hypothetical protein